MGAEIETSERLVRLEMMAEQAHKDREAMQAQLERLTTQLSDLNNMLNQAKGVRLTLGVLIAIGSFIGGVAGYFGVKFGIAPIK